MTERKKRHPNSGDLYTPVTPELVALFERMKNEHGTWRRVAAISETRLKVLRNLRQAKRKAVSQRLLDRICSSTGVGSIHEFTWFTADDLVALGIWDPVQYVEGYDTYASGEKRADKAKRLKEEARKKRRAEARRRRRYRR